VNHFNPMLSRQAFTQEKRLDPLHHPPAIPGLTPEVRETEHVEAPWLWTPVAGLPEVDQLGLLGVDREPVLGESLHQHGHHASRVHFLLEHDRDVVGIPDQTR
jgi:hypothetical protein